MNDIPANDVCNGGAREKTGGQSPEIQIQAIESQNDCHFQPVNPFLEPKCTYKGTVRFRKRGDNRISVVAKAI
jgi:hypothetical protein